MTIRDDEEAQESTLPSQNDSSLRRETPSDAQKIDDSAGGQPRSGLGLAQTAKVSPLTVISTGSALDVAARPSLIPDQRVKDDPASITTENCESTQTKRALLSYREEEGSVININKPTPQVGQCLLDASHTPTGELALQPLTYGVDRLVLLLPLSSDMDGRFLTEYRNGKQWPGLDFNLHVTIRMNDFTGRAQARLDFNPSRVLHPESSALASADDSVFAARWVLDLLTGAGCDHLGQRDEEVKVQRCDIARDLCVRSPAAWIEALRGTRAKYSRKQHGYFDDEGTLTGIQSGTKGIAYKMYDKFRAHTNNEWLEAHNLRFEVQLTGVPRCQKIGLGNLARLTQKNLDRVSALLWTRSRYGNAMLRDDAATIIMQTPHYAPHKAAMLGQYVALERGISLGVAAGHSLNADLRKCGLISRSRRLQPVKAGWRLDWSSGVEVRVG